MNFRSHTRSAIETALTLGREVYRLDTGNSGEDDILLADEESAPCCRVSDLRSDIMDFHDLSEWPEGWTLTRIYSLN